MPVKNKKNHKKKSTQSLLPFGEIKNNSVLLKDGGIRAVLQVSTINFNLKSEEEQNSTINAYQQFLNTLDFPLQICIQSRKVDLDPYFKLLQTKQKEIENPLLKAQTDDYMKYIKKISEYADIMEKKFFVVIPADPLRTATKKNIISQLFENMSPQDSLDKVKTRYLEFKNLSIQLQERINIINAGLERCGLRTHQLNNQELVDTYYSSYNPTISQFEKVEARENYNFTI